MPCKGLAANGQSLGTGQLLEESGKKLKNLKTGAGSGSSLWQWLVLPTTFSAYLPFCSFCKLKHQRCAQALQKGSAWPCERAPALICSHAGKMEKKWQHGSSSNMREAEEMSPLGPVCWSTLPMACQHLGSTWVSVNLSSKTHIAVALGHLCFLFGPRDLPYKPLPWQQ